jgi:6-pyruvoyltetrahydropterin/6-carboxytetrahydropterin synthase
LIRLTRRYRFSASHRLHSPRLNAAENRDTYGKCDNPFGHGHNYTLEVTVAGPVDAKLGRAADVSLLDRTVDATVLRRLDRRNLNAEVAEFAGDIVPTTENLAVFVRQRLLADWPRELAPLSRLRIFETRNNVFEIEEKA